MNEQADPPVLTFAGRLRVADFAYHDERQSAQRKLRSAAGVLSSGQKRKAEDEPGAREPARTGAVLPRSPSQASSLAYFQTPCRTASRISRNARPPPSRYAPPVTYAHLPLLPDAVGPGLLVLFIGLNPGVQTARTGHAYAHPSNLFWKLLHRTGITPVAVPPTEDRALPTRFRLGLTNIVDRPSRNGGELSRAEMDAGVAALEAKTRHWRPEAVCLVGKSIWESVVRTRYGRASRNKPAFRYGWQDASENMGCRLHDAADNANCDANAVAEGVRDDPDWDGARVFVASSTSGLAASLSPAQKEAIWLELGTWVAKRRGEIEAETGEKWV